MRLPQATPEGRVRCPRCKATFSPVVEAEEALSESVAVVLDDPRDTDDSFLERLANADDPFSPPPRAPFEVIAEAESVIAEPTVEPAKPKRQRTPEPEPEARTRGNGLVFAAVGLVLCLMIGGLASAGYVAWKLLNREAEPTNAAAMPKTEGPPKLPEEALAKVTAATVHVRTMFPDGQSTSSAGFFVPGPGLILTNARSVGQGQKKIPALKVMATCGTRSFAARILAADADLDLALLQVAGLDLPDSLPMNGDTFTVREPMPLVVFTAEEKRIANTNVTISGSKSVAGTRPWFLLNGMGPSGTWGGPVTDGTGKVVGVSSVLSGGESAVVPVEAAWAFVQTAAHAAELGGGVAFATADAARKSRDEWDGGEFPGMPNQWRPGRGVMPPGWENVPQPIFPPGFEPPMLPNFPRVPRDRR